MSVEQVGPGSVSNSYGVRTTKSKLVYDNTDSYQDVFIPTGSVPVVAIPSTAVNPSPGTGSALQVGGVSFPKQPISNGLVIWGESLAAMCSVYQDATTVRYLGNNWAAWGLHLAGWPCQLLNVGGHSGWRTDQVIPYFKSDVEAFAPGRVVIAIGVNNIIQGVSLSATMTDLQTMISLCRTIGAEPAICTVAPGESFAATTTLRDAWQRQNQSVRALCASQNIDCIEWEDAYLDPASANSAPLSGYTDGSVHPNNRGAMMLGQRFASWLRYRYPQPVQLRSVSQGAWNAISNPRMSGTAGTVSSGVTGQAPTGNTANKTANLTVASSIVPRTDEPGNWWQLAVTAATPNNTDTSYNLSNQLTISGSQFSVGDTVYGMCDLEMDTGGVGVALLDMRVRFWGSSGVTYLQSLTLASASGNIPGTWPSMRQKTPEFAIPAGTTALQMYIYANAIGGTPMNATYRIGNACIVKR